MRERLSTGPLVYPRGYKRVSHRCKGSREGCGGAFEPEIRLRSCRVPFNHTDGIQSPAFRQKCAISLTSRLYFTRFF
jgi:hypothetical protein